MQSQLLYCGLLPLPTADQLLECATRRMWGLADAESIARYGIPDDVRERIKRTLMGG